MSVEYLVLGVILVVMGAVQTWLRHGAWAKEQAEAARSGSGRPVGAPVPAGGSGEEDDQDVEDDALEGPDPGAVKATNRRGKAWGAWTAILGPLSIILGIVLIVLGVLER